MQLAGFSFIVPDVTASVEFYTKAFGFALRYMHPTGQYAEMETGAVLLSFTGEVLWEGMIFGSHPYRRAVSGEAPFAGFVALNVPDLDAALDRAVEAGAEKLTDPDAKPWGQSIALIRDLNGNLVELATMPVR